MSAMRMAWAPGGFRQIDRQQRRDRPIGGAAGIEQLQQQPGVGAPDGGDGGTVLAVQRMAQGRDAVSVNIFQQVQDQPREGQVKTDAFQAEARECFRRGKDNFGIGLRRIRADEFDAGLRDLATILKIGPANAHALAEIGQPERPGRLAQAGAGNTADLRRDVGAKSDHPLAFRVHQPKSLVGGGKAGTREQAILELQKRRAHPLIAMGGEAFHDRFDGFRLKLGFRRQHIAQSDRQ